MRKNTKKTPAFLFAALAAAVFFGFTSPAISAVPGTADTSQIEQAGLLSEGALLAKAGGAADDFPRVPKNRGRFGPTRLFNDDGSLDDFSITRAKMRPRVDDAPKPHIGPHKLMEEATSDDMILAKRAKRARPAIDAPIRKAPHPPGTFHG